MDIQDVIKYVNETPNNTNPAVLKGMVKAIVESSESGGGSVEPFFFVAEIKEFDQQSGVPIIEETSTTSYNDVISKLENGCPIYGRLIVPPEYSSLTNGIIDGIFSLIEVSRAYDSTSGNYEYFVRFGTPMMNFHATTPTDVLSMSVGDGGGGDDTPTVL